MMKKCFYLLLIALSISGCSKYGYVSLNYPQAPEAYLPDDINYIAVVNRSLVEEEDAGDKLLEAVATSEVAGSDRLASDDCIKGAFDAAKGLSETEVIIPQKLRLYGTGTREMPELLDWELVTEICESEGTDALLVLETFDKVLGFDESGFAGSADITFDLSGGLPPPTALPETAYEAGIAYFQRFLPGFYVVRRDLYKRTSGSAKNQFEAGYRRAEVANWQGAIEIWDELSDHEKQKTAGRACLNIAVANEVLGNTDSALEWAKKSYEYYDDKLGRSYSKILLRRKSFEE